MQVQYHMCQYDTMQVQYHMCQYDTMQVQYHMCQYDAMQVQYHVHIQHTQRHCQPSAEPDLTLICCTMPTLYSLKK